MSYKKSIKNIVLIFLYSVLSSSPLLSYDISIYKGWNFLGIGKNQSIDVSQIKSACVEHIYSYENDAYIDFDFINKTGKLKTIKENMGFLVWSNSNCNFSFSDNNKTQDILHISSEWSLLGLGKKDEIKDFDFLSFSCVNFIHYFNGNTQTYSSYDVKSKKGELSSLKSNQGFFVHATNSCSINISSLNSIKDLEYYTNLLKQSPGTLPLNSKTNCFEFEEVQSYGEYSECVLKKEICELEGGKCPKIDKLYDDFIDSLFGNGGMKTGPEPEPEHNQSYDDKNIFDVIKDKIKVVKITNKDNLKLYESVWAQFASIIPMYAYTPYLSRFSVLPVNSSYGGLVRELKADLTSWMMYLNLDSYKDGVTQDTIHISIHEFGHILTLNNTQVNSEILENGCKIYFTGEGCSKQSSYIGKFQQNFWKGKSYEKDGNKATKEQINSDFVTQYGTTNPGEDIAESWTFFVLQNKKTNTTKIKDQKVNYFYQFPELINLRLQIKKNLRTNTRSFIFDPIKAREQNPYSRYKDKSNH